MFDILSIVAALLVAIVAFQIYTYYKKEQDLKSQCGFCGSKNMLGEFMGDHKNVYLGLEADAQICANCGSVRINNPAFLENLVLMCNDEYLFQVFLNIFGDEARAYNGPAFAKLEGMLHDISALRSTQLRSEFIDSRREKALSAHSDDLPFERFMSICKKDISDLIEDLEDDMLEKMKVANMEAAIDRIKYDEAGYPIKEKE